jgi:hypothetical protein
MARMRLRKYDRDAITTRAMEHCECDRIEHDHGASDCPRSLGPKARFVFKEGVPHIHPSQLNVIIVCPTCRSYIDREKGIVSG